MKNELIIEDKSFISKIDGKNISIYKLIFPKIITEGDDRSIEFLDEFYVTCYEIEEDTDLGYKAAHIEYDFGMENTIPLTKKHNFILYDHEDKTDFEKIVIDISFDLFHAFFHTSDDPNYSTYHWALYGNLKDRIKAVDNDE